jgi:cytochrome P450
MSANRMDKFDFVLPVGAPVPEAKAELYHLGSVALQLLFAGYGPVSDWFYGVLFFLFDEPECYKLLVQEIRALPSYENITHEHASRLPYLNACLEETLRLLQTNNTGLPRYSPGAVVDGHFIPKGVR